MTDHGDPGREAGVHRRHGPQRGYVLDYHKVMAAQDYDVLQATNGLVDAAYLSQRTLDRRTKELLFILSLTVMRASEGPHHLATSGSRSTSGVSSAEILEAIEIALPEAGIVAFQCGFDAWREVVGADGHRAERRGAPGRLRRRLCLTAYGLSAGAAVAAASGGVLVSSSASASAAGRAAPRRRRRRPASRALERETADRSRPTLLPA